MKSPDGASAPGDRVYDAIVIGAGAAGLMVSIIAARGGLRVLLLDGREKIGAKILMSGGTRCNITNAVVTEKDFESEQKRTLSAVLKAFGPEQALGFFRQLGIEVVQEPGGKYFPSTHSGKTVLEALMRGVWQSRVELVPGRKVTRVLAEKDFFRVEGKGFSSLGKTVVLTTGGLSYPQTGSDGSGYGLALVFGHTLIPTTPSLTPLLSGDDDLKKLSGVTLPARLTFFQDREKKAQYEGSFLFTHTGFSGPVVLNVSRHWIRGREKGRAEISANFLPQVPEEMFREKMIEETRKNPGRLVKSFLGEFLPRAFVEMILERQEDSPPTVTLNQLKKDWREKYIQNLFHFQLPVNGALGYEKAEVTAGGVDLKEIEKTTLESKLRPGLFFAGEILDADGRIGGFNFQWAWASGFLAGQGVIKRLKMSSSASV